MLLSIAAPFAQTKSPLSGDRVSGLEISIGYLAQPDTPAAALVCV
jgi:hypothetical protein